VGVAQLEQFHQEEAAASFRKALELDPTLALARANLAIALLNLAKAEDARTEARAAAALLPGVPQPLYVIALASRALSDNVEAQKALRRVLEIDPQDVGARVNLAQVLIQERQFAEAAEVVKAATAADPASGSAAYTLGLALLRSGQAEEGEKVMARFRALREAPYATFLGQNYPDQGRYAEAVATTGAEPELVDPATPAVRFTDASARWLGKPAARARTDAGAPPGRVTLADLDGDGDLDVLGAGPEGLRVLRNAGGKLGDVTAALGFEGVGAAVGAVAGDLDNDGRPEVLVTGPAGPRLFHHDGARFSDATAQSGLPRDAAASAAALSDLDHDGDLDVVLATAASLLLLQNDGQARFKDVSAAAAFGPGAATVALLPTDFDNHRDMDLMVAGDGPLRLFQNRRDGTFREVAAEAGLARAARFRAAAAADVNKDGFTDFFFGLDDGPGAFFWSDGRGRFTSADAPPPARNARQALLLDYDGDGLLDLVVLAAAGLHVARNQGGGRWADATQSAVEPVLRAAALGAFAAGDMDGDGDTDLVARDANGALRVLENGGGTHRGLRVSLSGLASNRGGIGAKVEMRAGSLRQKLETSATTPPIAPADVVFGLGPRPGADAVRVLWPSGTLQAELTTSATLAVKELDRKPSSCPFLYAWNGRSFAFITDFMGGGEMGNQQAPGLFSRPDPDEYVRLRDDQLVARDGRYELRVTNELEEALFVDRLALLAVDHPGQVEVYPDEGLLSAPRGFGLRAVRGLRPVLSARDDAGRDQAPALRALDRVFADGFPLQRIRGYAQEHGLVLDLGPAAGDETVLLLTGWTDYAFSSDNIAAAQAGLGTVLPRLEVEDAPGRWRTAREEIGFPVGRPQTVLVPLRGLWRGPSRRVRIVTSLRVYWDQAAVGTAAAPPAEPRRLEATRADLAERGFSAPVLRGRETIDSPFDYDYTRVRAASPWKQLPGRYTRTGDVRELLGGVDDVFVVSRPGDEIALSFDAGALPPLPAGWRRTFLLHADGFSKEMDPNSASPLVLEPLPFHGMPHYPYAAPVAFPWTPERQALVERYNTRVVRAPMAGLELTPGAGGAP
jgi:Flp pilus assembly protein TadD